MFCENSHVFQQIHFVLNLQVWHHVGTIPAWNENTLPIQRLGWGEKNVTDEEVKNIPLWHIDCLS